MTDTRESYYHDVSDLRDENAKLRAELDALRAAPADPAASPWADHLAKMHKERDDALAELRALRAAPSAEEIEAWEKRMHSAMLSMDHAWDLLDAESLKPFGVHAKHAAVRKCINEAVALMRRASAAPAQSDAVESHKQMVQACWFPMSAGIRKVAGREEPPRKGAAWLEWFCGMVREFAWFVPPGDAQLAGEIAARLAAAPEAKEPSGVGAVVPEDVIDAAKRAASQPEFWVESSRRCANFILSLPTPQPAAALDDTRRSERAEGDAPSDAEIEAWRVMWAKRIRTGLEMGEDDALLAEAVALMRRAKSAPAPSAAAGVAVPDGVRRWAKTQAEEEGNWPSDDPVSVGRWILSLAAAPQQPQAAEPGIHWRGINTPGVDGGLIVERDDGARLRWVGVDGVDNTDGNRMPLAITLELKRGDVVLNTETYRPEAPQPQPDAELQRLLAQLAEDEFASVVWCETVERLFNVLARKAGAS